MHTSDIIWRTRGGRRIVFPPFLLAGIVNVTPDSFSDGQPGLLLKELQVKAIELAMRLKAEGADILDIGGESTRPGADDIGEAEEVRRILPVLLDLQRRLDFDECPPRSQQASLAFRPLLSVDTWRAATARAVLEAGADMINDISGGTFDNSMTDVLVEYAPAYVLGHSPAKPACMQDAPVYTDVIEELYTFFAKRMEALIKAGLPEECIALDPCIGFGKTLEQNLLIFKNIKRFHSLGRPLYFGISRKSFFDGVLGLAVEKRDLPTCAMTGILAAHGVQIHRVHSVYGAKQALKLAELIPVD